MNEIPRNTILQGDAVERLKDLPPSSIDCVITSPPYYRLRDYGVPGQIGHEAHIDGWVDTMRAVFAELARILKPTGSVWLNLGDTFSKRPSEGAPQKSLLLGPERLAMALVGDGWILRNKIVWDKTRTTPHPTTDRLTSAYEVIYFLVRFRDYFFDLHAIRDGHLQETLRKGRELFPALQNIPDELLLGRNPGDVWRIAPSLFPGAHFATFPSDLVRRPLLATCPSNICTLCGKPWSLGVTTFYVPTRRDLRERGNDKLLMNYPTSNVIYLKGKNEPGCLCNDGIMPGVVLDPFFGSGTVGQVAQLLARDWIGVELNEAYVQIAEERLC